jgi:sirohydrochlorin ferrochelatase
MNGVLVLAHGSKRQETEETLDALIKLIKEKTGEQLVIPVYLQFSQPDLQAGITQLVESGADSIKVIPMFLFDGIHVTWDIPQELTAIKQKYPHIAIKISKHLGADERIADILVDRIKSLD